MEEGIPRVMQRSNGPGEHFLGPAGLGPGGALLALLGHRRVAAVGGLGDQGALAQRQPALDPVAHAHLVGLVLFLDPLLLVAGVLQRRLIFLVGQFGAGAHVLGPLARGLGEVVDRPATAEVRIAPFGARDLPFRPGCGGRCFLGGPGGGDQQRHRQRGAGQAQTHRTSPLVGVSMHRPGGDATARAILSL
jgi:hypothetical protein